MPACAGWVTFPLERPDVTGPRTTARGNVNLTSPVSVPPAEHFRLIQANRTAHDLPADTPPPTT